MSLHLQSLFLPVRSPVQVLGDTFCGEHLAPHGSVRGSVRALLSAAAILDEGTARDILGPGALARAEEVALASVGLPWASLRSLGWGVGRTKAQSGPCLWRPLCSGGGGCRGRGERDSPPGAGQP